MSAIELLALEKRFASLRALAGISTTIASGSSVLVRGPNGAGKSTLLRVLAGLVRPTRGSVRVLGADPFGAAGAETRGRVGYLGSEPGLYGELSIDENLSYIARLHGLARDRVDRIVARLCLEEVRARRVRALSSGYRQRAGLARALLPDPELLLLDEPWNALDSEAAALLAAELTALREAGRTLLIAAHTAQAREIDFDRVLVLEAGRLVS